MCKVPRWGIIGTVTGTAGIIISNELIKNSVGISSDLKGKVLIINLEIYYLGK